MARVTVIHWKPEEAADKLEQLRQAGHNTRLSTPKTSADLAALYKNAPDVLVIDLTRLPGQGRDMGLHLRQRNATRNVAIVFVGGDPQKVSRYKQVLPDAIYTSWSQIRGAISRAIKDPLRQPVVRNSLAGHSGTPLPKKLGIQTGKVIALLGEPQGFRKTLGPLPNDVHIRTQARGKADVILLFVKSAAELERRLPAARRTLADGGRLWIIWPKKAAGTATNLTQQIVRKTGLATGLVDYKIAAIDAM